MSDKGLSGQLELGSVVEQFAVGLKVADALRPQALSHRTGKAYQAGLGPHSENAAVRLVLAQMAKVDPIVYSTARPLSYPASRLVCDLGIGSPPEWAIE